MNKNNCCEVKINFEYTLLKTENKLHNLGDQL
jgi:hypothetical protein